MDDKARIKELESALEVAHRSNDKLNKERLYYLGVVDNMRSVMTKEQIDSLSFDQAEFESVVKNTYCQAVGEFSEFIDAHHRLSTAELMERHIKELFG